MSDTIHTNSNSSEYRFNTDSPTDHPFTTVDQIESYDWTDFDRVAVERKSLKPYQDPRILAHSYWIEDLSQEEIATRYGVTPQAISWQMKKQEIPTVLHPSHYQASLGYTSGGDISDPYEWVWSHCNGEQHSAYIHRLVACVENDPHEVFREGTNVHHATGHPLDNRPDVVEVLDQGEHQHLHKSHSVQWVIEDGEPRLKESPVDEPNPVEEWWNDTDDGVAQTGGDDYGLSVEK